MQQHQPERRFNTPPQQPVYRFPQNQQAQGWQPQQTFLHSAPVDPPRLSRKEQRQFKKLHKRRRIFTWWNLFAVIGIITTIVQLARYLIIPLLVYLNVLQGGAL